MKNIFTIIVVIGLGFSLYAQNDNPLSTPPCFPGQNGVWSEHEVSVQRSPAAFTYTTHVLYQNGPASNRVNLGYASEGYTKSDLAVFPAQMDKAVNYIKKFSLAMRPIPRYFKFFNIYRIDLVSAESGLSQTTSFGQPNIKTVNNALGGTKDQDRLGWVNNTLGAQLFTDAGNKIVVKFHWCTTMLNDPGYYNSGASINCFSFNNFGDIANHEMGHSFHDLADEYYSTGTYTGGEPSLVNATKDPAGSKWAHWKGYVDTDKACGTIGAYEGGYYYSKGVYRPSPNSKMGWTNASNPVSYNAICREKIILDIYSIIRPVDASLDTTKQQVDPDSIWVKVIDPHVLWVDWYVNGNLVKKNGGTSLPKNQVAIAAGVYTVRAHVYDEVVLHANSSNTNPDSLDLVRKDLHKLQQDVNWSIRLTTGTSVDPVAGNPVSFTIYPVCNVGEFTVEAENLPDAMYTLEIIGAMGQMVYRQEINIRNNGYSRHFNLNDIPKGFYIVKLYSPVYQVHRKMIVK